MLVTVAFHRLHHGGAERRGQDQGHQDRQRHRRHDGDGELAIDHAGRTAKEGHRQEHRRQHQADADQGAGDFLHRFQRRVIRTELFLMHDALDVFDHDNRVVHQQADDQHEREQRQRVYRVAEHGQDAEGAQQHDRHGNGGDQRGAPVLQEQVHHQHHQDDGFDQRHHHVADGKADEGGVVHRIDHLHARRQGGAQFFGALLHQSHGAERIGARRQHHGHTGGGVAIEQAGDFVGLRAQFDAGDIAQAHDGAAGRGLQHDFAELLRRLQARLGRDGGVELLALHGGLLADLAGGNLHVLRLDRGGHVRRHQAEILQLERVQPDAHRILRAEHLGVAHARHAGELVGHAAGDEVRHVDVVVAAGIVIDADDDDEVGLVLGDGDADLLHLRGQLGNSGLHLVLHLHLGDVRIGAGREGDGDAGAAIGVRGRREIEQVVQARELLLDNLCDGVLHRLGIGAGIDGVDHHRRRGDGGILFDRQAGGGDAARQHGDDGDDPGENRVVDEEAGERHLVGRRLGLGARSSRRRAGRGCGRSAHGPR